MIRLQTALVLLGSLFLTSTAFGQGFLQRLSDQLSQPLPPPVAPADPAPPAISSGAPRADAASFRPSLGINVSTVTPEIQRSQGLVVRQGALVTARQESLSAATAGIPVGAVIVAYDGRRIDTSDDLIAAVQRSRVGQTVELTYYDRNRLMRTPVTLSGIEESPLILSTPSTPRRDVTSPVPGPGVAPANAPPRNPDGSANLERQLNADGSRPLLGRIGRALDTLAPSGVAPAQATQPIPPADDLSLPVPRNSSDQEMMELRQQVLDLSRELDALRRQVLALERKLPANAR